MTQATKRMRGSAAKQKGRRRVLMGLHSSEGCSSQFGFKLTGAPWRRVSSLFLNRPHMHFSRLLPSCGPGRQKLHMLLQMQDHWDKTAGQTQQPPPPPQIFKNHLSVSAWLHRKLILISLSRKFRLLFFPPSVIVALGFDFPQHVSWFVATKPV